MPTLPAASARKCRPRPRRYCGPAEAALTLLNAEVTRQAVFIAYLDDFKLMMIVTFAVLPLLLLMRKGRQTDVTPHVAMD